MTTCGVLRVRDLPLTNCPFLLPRAMAEVETVPPMIEKKDNSRYRIEFQLSRKFRFVCLDGRIRVKSFTVVRD